MSPVVAENEQIGPNEADDIKNDEFKRKIQGLSAELLIMMESDNSPYFFNFLWW